MPDTADEPNATDERPDERDTVDNLNATDAPDAADDANHVAIIGMAGRFPGASGIDAFWRNLEAGRETIAALTDEELLASGVTAQELADPRYVRAKGVLEDGDRFDAAFFGYTPREAELMDPQHRVFLECAWEALESAGCDPTTFEGRIGVFAGASLNSYLLFNIMGNRRVYDSTGLHRTLLAGDKDFLATRASYKFDLKGPAVTVQTACSTSLTAVHLACQSLLNGECDIALAGGVSVSVPLKSGYLHEQGGILSAQGHCRAFDVDADGTVAGNGTGIVVLRRLADARAHGDEIDAVVRGTAVNNDGALKAGYTAPSVEGQAEVIAEALAVAEVDPASVGYVETHGTGTALGDPIEIAALTRAYREHTDETGYCAIGSVKSSVGHLDAAAGVTALIKATLALKRQAIPATLGFTRPHPELALADSPFFVNDRLRPWPRADGAPRRAGVSAFGIGGTNVHVVLEEAPDAAPGGPSRAVQLLPLAARTAPALVAGARRLADHLERHPELPLGDVAHTLARGRRAFGTRAGVVCRDTAEAVTALRALTEADARPAADRAPVAFLFPGQGSQYAGMARTSTRTNRASRRKSTGAPSCSPRTWARTCARCCTRNRDRRRPRTGSWRRPPSPSPRCSPSSTRWHSCGCPGGCGPARWPATASASTSPPAWPASSRSRTRYAWWRPADGWSRRCPGAPCSPSSCPRTRPRGGSARTTRCAWRRSTPPG